VADYLVDTGVFVRWFVDQVGFEHAREVQGEWTSGLKELATVDFVRIELAEVLRKRGLLDGLLTKDEYYEAAALLDDVSADLTIHPVDAVALALAAQLAASHMLRLFDALLVGRALTEDLPLLTSDVKLARAASSLIDIEVLRGLPPV
jgi:predicted nucleic acid-binding protein